MDVSSTDTCEVSKYYAQFPDRSLAQAAQR
jgi:hypothetical protein